MRVLIAEDEAVSRRLLERILCEWGHEVVSVTDGVQAWEELQREGAPQLAILDWVMPNMDGLEVCRKARACDATKSIYIILLTGRVGKSDIAAGLAAGANEYLTKPFDQAELQARLQTGGRMIEMQAAILSELAERRRAEEILRVSEQRFRSLIDHSSDAIALFDLDGAILYASPSTPQVLGYAPEEFVRLNALEIIHPNDRKFVRGCLKQALKQPRVGIGGEARVLHKDGSWRWMEGTLTNLIDEPSVRAVVNNYRDITERKRAEQALHEAGQRALVEYERLLARLAQLALSFGTGRDLLTIYRGLLDFCLSLTPSFAIAICRYDEARSVREGVYFCLNGIELDAASAGTFPVRSGPVGRAIKTGTAVVSNDYIKELASDATHLGKENDAEMPRSALIAPMTIRGRVIGTLEVQSHEENAYTREHVTAIQMAANLAANAIENVRLFEREREKEEQLRQALKMEAVGKLAGGVAHDFNNLLTAITGYSDLSLRNLEQDNPLHLNIKEIKKAGERAASLTRQLLAFSRKQVLQPVVLDLNATVNNIGKMLQRLIGEHIELVLSLKPALGHVKADPGQIEQVLMNLVVNARDAMRHGGKLIIETANVELTEEYAAQHVSVQPGSYVRLSVTDTGHGIDAETMKHIFEPFFTTKEIGSGTGLGLSTVFGIIKQSGGNIWVYSEVGRGTTFKIYLPRVIEEVKLPERITVDHVIAQGDETILLVEDEPMVRAIARETLEMSGYRVFEAANGHEALSITESLEERIDLVLTDVIMPQLGGKEMTEQLVLRRPDAKILYMSGYTDDALLHQGILDEGIAFLEKPFTPDSLSKRVREVLDTAKGNAEVKKD